MARAPARPKSKKAAPSKKKSSSPKKRAAPQKRPMEVKPRIGAIPPEDFEAAVSAALGGYGWQKSFRAGTGIAQSTLTRYLRGIFPIPKTIAVIVEMLQTLRNKGLPVPDSFTIK